MALVLSQHLRRYREIAALVWRHRPAIGATREGASHEAAQQLANDLEHLGPTFIKLGQVLSTRPDLMPMPYIQALSRLQDDVSPFDIGSLERIIEDELKMPIERAYASFDEQPLAAASLGQVHMATTHDGKHVVVKVQRPGIRERVLEDMDALASAAKMLDKHTIVGRNYEFGLMLEEFKASLLRELDYSIEARNLSWLADTLLPFFSIVVPRPVMELTTTRVLTMDYIEGTKITALSKDALANLKGDALAEDVFRAYLKQILVDGKFHADPHPGNVLLTPDGRVALIDLGMVAYLSPSWRDGLFRLLLAVAEGRSDEVADVCLELSDVRDDFDERVFRKRTAMIVSQQQHAAVKDMDVGRLVVDIAQAATSSGMRVPSELTMLGKTLMNLDSVGRTLSPHFTPTQAIRAHATELMQARMKQQVSPEHLFQKALELNDLVQRLPSRVNRVIEALARNRLKITVDMIDEKVIIEGMQKVANRIAAGVVLAALIVGSTMMMKVETRFTIAGYPGFAILMFVAAVTGSAMLVFDVVVRDELLGRRKGRRRAPPGV